MTDIVKEFIENSLDANATEILIEIENGGIDNERFISGEILQDKIESETIKLKRRLTKVFTISIHHHYHYIQKFDHIQ